MYGGGQMSYLVCLKFPSMRQSPTYSKSYPRGLEPWSHKNTVNTGNTGLIDYEYYYGVISGREGIHEGA
jgi:hypothetical protein